MAFPYVSIFSWIGQRYSRFVSGLLCELTCKMKRSWFYKLQNMQMIADILLTRTTSWMIQSVVALQSAYIQLKHALVFERSRVRRTHLFFIWRAVFFAHATGVKCVECLADSKVIACNVDARVKVFGIVSNIISKWAVLIVFQIKVGSTWESDTLDRLNFLAFYYIESLRLL